MNIFAYCCASFEKSVQKAAGVQPLLSPPITFKQFLPDILMERDLIYFKLHGQSESPWWYGDNFCTAFHVDLLRNITLKGTVVFVANCHLEESPFLEALLRTGATVIGGSGPNFAQSTGIVGADLLGMYVRRVLATRISPARALVLAKVLVAAKTQKMSNLARHTRDPGRATDLRRRAAANADALQFKIYGGKYDRPS